MDYNNELIVARLPEAQFNLLEDNKPIDELVGMPVQPELYIKINSFSDLLSLHENIIKLDASSLDTSDYHHDCFQLIGNPAQLFIHNTAQLEPCFLDTQNGPIIIESDVKILAGTSIKGPCVIGTDSLVKSNAVIYGPFSCGPKCVLAGELKSTIFQGYSNKGHFGYIGDSVIGAFCNLGGGTSASNVKNTLTTVHLWDYQEEKFIDTERMKLGMVLGDYSKTAIHTAFNTGTVIGLSCNIYSKGFPRKFIPSFSWGGSAGYINYELEKALEVASVTKSTKGEHMSENEKNMLAAVYKMSEKYRASYK